MTQPAPWSARLVRLIAGEIKRWRDKREMSAQQLADACEKLGHPIPRSVIANLESGRRETISLPELLVLACALEVPASQLVFPVGSAEEVEILPGQRVSAEEALLWFTGWADLFRDQAVTRTGHGARDRATGLHEWYETGYEDAGAPIHMYAEHRDLLARYYNAEVEARRRLPRDVPESALRDLVPLVRRQVEELIGARRAEMRRRGLAVLPDLPDELEHLR